MLQKMLQILVRKMSKIAQKSYHMLQKL